MDDVIVLGGGYAGLGAAYRLNQLGLRTTLIEAGRALGGHAACCTLAGVAVERFYHHYKPEDEHVLRLVRELGLADRLAWKKTRMGFLIDGRLHPFSSPLDLLRFSPFGFADKLRFAWGVLRAQWTDPAILENVSAAEWSVRDWSPAIYERMMRPLLTNKFEVAPEAVSAAFLQGRIRAVAGTKSKVRSGERLAYLKGGLDLLTERLAAAVSRTCEVVLDAPVDRIESAPNGFTVRSAGRVFRAANVVNTLPLDVFDRMEKDFPFANPVAYQGVCCAVFAVAEPLTPLYWINVLDQAVSFRLLVNQSALGEYPHSVLYCSNYVSPDDPILDAEPQTVLDRYRNDLERLFGRLTIKDAVLSRSRQGTPVFDKDYRRKVRYLESAVPKMAFAGNAMVFPGARTVSSVIGTGFRAADAVARSVGE